MPVGRTVLRAIAGAMGGALGVRLAGHADGWLGPVQVRAELGLTRQPGVIVDLAPAGTARLRSRRGPVRIVVRAIDLDPTRAAGLLTNDEGAGAQRLDAALRTAGDQGRKLAVPLATRSVLAAMGGAAATAACTLRRPRDVVGATATAAGLLAATTALTAVATDRDAWREPELRGLVERAPMLLGDLRTAPDRIAGYRDQLVELLHTATAVYHRIATLPEPPPHDAIRVLHISDLHLSPLAYPLTAALIGSYGIDVVVDTGDLVDWGTPPEQLFANEVAKLGVPYVFVKGNHDSDGIAAAVAAQPNATVLSADRDPVEVAGLRFAGMSDPRFTPDKRTGDDHAEHRVSAAAAEFAVKINNNGVDVALAHDPAAARALAGTVPLVLAGHTHHRSTLRHGDTVVVIQGSTGGSGLRSVQQEPATPVALSVLFIDRTTRRLRCIDDITLGGLGSVSIDVTRRSVEDLVT